MTPWVDLLRRILMPFPGDHLTPKDQWWAILLGSGLLFVAFALLLIYSEGRRRWTRSETSLPTIASYARPVKRASGTDTAERD